jgi:hypothetical protein
MKIERASNGFILTHPNYYLDGEEQIETKEVFETDKDELQELESVVNMLYSILEWSGYAGSKHDKHRIRITIEESKL